ncbi:hypothetical protein GCM10010302_17630 [Streptomyces polychromogenes]|uniref:Uncharacterized protein n=1 Tax=Streptomyces polychromogenes TaxID=67342 RepID=A0ABP3EX92_9ACTN
MSRIRLHRAQVITMTPQRPDAEHVDVPAACEAIAAVGDVIEAPGSGVADFSGRVIIGEPALARLLCDALEHHPEEDCQAPGGWLGTLRDECPGVDGRRQAPT